MKIIIKINENEYKIDVNEITKIKYIKYAIEDTKNISFNQQTLIFNNKVLEDNNTIHDYNINENSQLILVRKNNNSINVNIYYDNNFYVITLQCNETSFTLNEKIKKSLEISRKTKILINGNDIEKEFDKYNIYEGCILLVTTQNIISNVISHIKSFQIIRL